MKTLENVRTDHLVWFARAALGSVLALNIECALAFILWPEQYAGAFELNGLPGKLAVQSLGILFLMWNVTYPPVLLTPRAQKTLFAVILAQQLIGLAGETWLLLQLPAGHPALWQTGQRFILFDGIGFLLMGTAYLGLSIRVRPAKTETDRHG